MFVDSKSRIQVPTKINVRIEITGHKCRRTTAIKRAVLEVLANHRLMHNFSPMKKLLGDDLELLYFRTLSPISANGSAKSWVRSLRRQVTAAIREANRGTCDAKLRAEFVHDA
jgi:hypothetical protein